MREAVLTLLEVLCVALVAVGVALWVAPGAGLVAGGGLGLLLVVAAQLPIRSVGDG